jgi:hypothetical protein
MNRFALLALFCAVMALAITAFFNLLTTVNTVVPGATASPTLVAGILLLMAAISGSTTLAILRSY